MTGRSPQAELTMHIRPTDLCRTPPTPSGEVPFVAQLGSAGLGSTSYVVGRGGSHTPEWIVLAYAAGDHERVWRRKRRNPDGVVAYVLVADDSSDGYVTVA